MKKLTSVLHKGILKNERMQGVLVGVLISTMCCGGVALAKQASEMIEVQYNNIKVYKDNVLCELKDANGTVIEPFIYNGTTYMPVRGTASLADMQVTWDGATQSVYLWDEMVPARTSFLEECPPYDTSGMYTYYASKGDAFTMAGERYSNGLRTSCIGRATALFNLNSKYSTLECTIGHESYEQTQKHISFIVDGKVVEEIELEPECLPKTVKIPLKYGLQLKITSDSEVGIGNMTVE